jgi:hypothetical protein
MKTCQKCGGKNLNSSSTCEECGVTLETETESKPVSAKVPYVTPAVGCIDEGYIRAHFNGNQSLRRSFWVNWFAINCALDVILYRILGQSTPLQIYITAFLNEMLGVESVESADLALSSGEIAWFVVRFLISIWQAVGLWRSLRQGRGGKWLKRWVKVVFVLNVLINLELILVVLVVLLWGPVRRYYIRLTKKEGR